MTDTLLASLQQSQPLLTKVIDDGCLLGYARPAYPVAEVRFLEHREEYESTTCMEGLDIESVQIYATQASIMAL